MEIVFFVLAILIGGIASWQIFNWRYAKKLKENQQQQVQQEATILLERIEKVFKVVVAEGYFSEIYDHNSKKDFWGLFHLNRKALVVAKAKVSVGYDFSKMKTRYDEQSRKLVVESFPEAEVLSIDTDYKFYDIDQGMFSKFSHEDYTNIITEAKKLMQEKALVSDLPKVANRQIGLMMNQLAASMDWKIDFNQLPPKTEKLLEEFGDAEVVKE